MGILDAFKRKREPFPEEGIYKGVRYRVDGDSVIVRCSNGREIGLNPSLPSEIFDKLRAGVLDKKIQFDDAMLAHWGEPPDPNKKRTGGGPNEGIIVRGSVEKTARAYGISVVECMHLLDTGNEIMIKYWRAKIGNQDK